MAMVKRSVPNLALAQRVVDKMADAASRFIADETGEAMVGLIVADTQTKGASTIFVLDTIAPNDSSSPGAAPVRQWGMFEQGDDWQDEVIWWLQENWTAYREKRRGSFGNALQAKWDAPLRYLGDWHKQPGYMIKPSFGDLMTALTWLDDDQNNMEFLLVPIVTLGHPSTTSNENGIGVNYITKSMDDDSDMRVDFWYIHRDVRMFQPINVTVMADDQLPGLTKYPWHLVNEDRFNTEVSQLHGDGLFTSITLWEADDKLPLEVCFLTARKSSDKVIIVITPWNYPEAAPSARVAPFLAMDEDDDIHAIFKQLWAQASPVKNPPGWKWTPEKFIIDYVHALEESLGLRPKESSPAAPAVNTGAAESAEADAKDKPA